MFTELAPERNGLRYYLDKDVFHLEVLVEQHSPGDLDNQIHYCRW